MSILERSLLRGFEVQSATDNMRRLARAVSERGGALHIAAAVTKRFQRSIRR